MDKTHKETLRQRRIDLVKSLHDVKSVVDHLYAKRTITEAMKEDLLEVCKTATDRKRALLDLLPKRGPSAFDEFFNALIDCQEWDAADLLKPGQGREAEFSQKGIPTQPSSSPIYATTAVEEEPPVLTLDETYVPQDVQVQEVHEHSEMVRLFENCELNTSVVYKMQGKPRGKVLIINNENFWDGLSLDNREGTKVDAVVLDKLFTCLHFKTILRENLAKSGMESEILRFQKADFSSDECFVLIVLSHGTEDGVYGVDGQTISVQFITDAFNSQNCRSLAGKPKLFFIQACRGKKTDTGSAGIPVHSAGEMNKGQPQNQEQYQGASDEDISLAEKKMKSLKLSDNITSDAQSEVNVGTRSDMFVAFATTPGFLSYRNTKKGTWFIQAISIVFQKFSHKEDLLSLMTKVNHAVGVGRSYNQVSVFTSSFSKKFYFFPGLTSTLRSSIQASS